MENDEIEAALTAARSERANDDEGPFSIGQHMWPGVAKLIEECGEVIQVAGKLIATGDDVINARRDRKVDLFNAWHARAVSPLTDAPKERTT